MYMCVCVYVCCGILLGYVRRIINYTGGYRSNSRTYGTKLYFNLGPVEQTNLMNQKILLLFCHLKTELKLTSIIIAKSVRKFIDLQD